MQVPHVVPVNHPPTQPPLDWQQALRAAASRLNEKWLLPATRDHPAVADMAVQLAALVCAYGKLSEEVDRMQARPDGPSQPSPSASVLLSHASGRAARRLSRPEIAHHE
jgi:hypothetical protein